jgi:hypothetical protein
METVEKNRTDSDSGRQVSDDEKHAGSDLQARIEEALQHHDQMPPDPDEGKSEEEKAAIVRLRYPKMHW